MRIWVVWHLQVKRKVDTLRENRDYSNLFSDDADTPPPTEERAENKPVMAPKSREYELGRSFHSPNFCA